MSADPPSYTSGEEATERVRMMMQFTPHGRALGLEVLSLDGGKVLGRAPYKPELVGDPETGVIAGGVITTFLDQLCGMATVLSLRQPSMVATIDLRIDYLRPAEPGRDVLAEAHCYKVGRNVAFVRAVAFEDTQENAIAHATATFMVNATRKFGANLKDKKPAPKAEHD
jgi:uncharacterized protein (TIGR00369 family)